MVWWSDPEALRQTGLRALHAGNLDEAFACTDRLCRIGDFPVPSDWLARAVVQHRLGWLEDVTADLDVAMRTGWCEPTVLRAIAALHPDGTARLDACRSLIASQRSSHDDLRFAMARMLELGGLVARRVMRTSFGLQGWVACRTGSPSEIHAKLGEHAGAAIPLGAPLRHDFGPAWQIRPIAIPVAPDRPAELAIRRENQAIETWTDIPRVLTTPSVLRKPRANLIDADVIVVVPIYGDAPTLRSCFAALRDQFTSLDVHVIVVDDCSPDKAVTKLGRDFCGAVGGDFVRLPVNAGFAAAVNTALDRVGSGDVLVLNSDVALPGGAIDRLHRAASSDAQIGTVSPLSNDAGAASFPVPFTRNPLPSEEEAQAIDGVAAWVNRGVVVDVVANLGSCLYLTDRCRRDVGLLSLAYGRGYYEDVDLCLRVRSAGYRNVVAPDVYVSHASSRSFGLAKRQLAAENRIVIETRFPQFDDAEAAFIYADPLAASRAAIEEALVLPGKPSVVVAAARGRYAEVIEERCAALAGEHRVIVAHWSRSSVALVVTLRAFKGQAPHSLRFDLTEHGRARLRTYLVRQNIRWFEIAGAHTLPDDLASCFGLVASCQWLLAGLDDTQRIVAMENIVTRSRSSASVAFGCETARPGSSVTPSDRMAAACLGVTFPGRESVAENSVRRHRSEPGLGILMPDACARSERFILDLARLVRRVSSLNLVVLGTCLDEIQLMSVGNVWVHRKIEANALTAVVCKTGVHAILSPYRDGHFGLLDRTATEAGVPKAYFDGSDGRLAVMARDLALPPDIGDCEASDRLVSWCAKVVVPEHERPA